MDDECVVVGLCYRLMPGFIIGFRQNVCLIISPVFSVFFAQKRGQDVSMIRSRLNNECIVGESSMR